MKFTCLLGSRISVFFSALHSTILQNPKSVSGAILNFTITERFFARCLVESYVWYENRGKENWHQTCQCYHVQYKSTTIFHGLHSYRPKKWRQHFQNQFTVKSLDCEACFHCKVLNTLTSFLWSIRVQTMKYCCRFVMTNTFLVRSLSCSKFLMSTIENNACPHIITTSCDRSTRIKWFRFSSLWSWPHFNKAVIVSLFSLL